MYSGQQVILIPVEIPGMNASVEDRPLAQEGPKSRSAEDWQSKPLAIQVRGSIEWKEWVEALAEANRQKVAGLIDTALTRFAKEMGFRDPPER